MCCMEPSAKYVLDVKLVVGNRVNTEVETCLREEINQILLALVLPNIRYTCTDI